MSLSQIDIVNRALTKIGSKRITSLSDQTEEATVAASLFDIVRDSELMAHSWTFAKRRILLAPEDTKPVWGWDLQYLLPSFCLRLLEVMGWPASLGANLIMNENRPFVQEHNRILTNKQYLVASGCVKEVVPPDPNEPDPNEPAPAMARMARSISTEIGLAQNTVPGVSISPKVEGMVNAVPTDIGDSVYQASFGINSECGCQKIEKGYALPILYIHREEVTAHWHPLFAEVMACKLAIEMCERLSGDTSKRQLAWQEYDRTLKTAKLINALGMPPKVLQDGTWMMAHMRGVM